MLWDLINWQKLKRALLYAIYMALVLLVQDALFSHISILGVRVMLVPAAAVAVGMFEGGVWGAVFSLALGFLADMSYGNTALFVALFPCIGFVSGALSRWLVNRRFFAYLCMALFFLALTALFQMAELLLMGQNAAELAWVGLWQTLFSLPFAAVLYFPCKSIAGARDKKG
mgnify:CR=1 FL=1